MRDNRASDFSQILQQVVFSYLVVHCKKICIGKLSLRPQSPKLAKVTRFALYLFIHPSDLYESLPKFGYTCYEHNRITVDPEKTGLCPPGAFRAKNTPLWGLF